MAASLNMIRLRRSARGSGLHGVRAGAGTQGSEGGSVRPKPGDSPAVADWRARMASEEAKAIYKDRAATAECVNAQARNRGLYQLRVRGKLKAKAIALWHALAHNMMRAVSLRVAARVRAAAAAGVLKGGSPWPSDGPRRRRSRPDRRRQAPRRPGDRATRENRPNLEGIV